MKSFALLAACFATVEAWQVLLYSGDNCAGDSYFIENAAPCKQPENMPADFDAKSMQVIDVPSDLAVWAFTDNNVECNHGFGAPSNTYLVYGANGGTACHPYASLLILPGSFLLTVTHRLKSTKTGKWRIVSVESV